MLRLIFLGHRGAVALALPGHDLPVLFHARRRAAAPELFRDLLPGALGTVLPDLRNRKLNHPWHRAMATSRMDEVKAP